MEWVRDRALLVEADGAKALGRGMKSIAARFARAVNRALSKVGVSSARSSELSSAPLTEPMSWRWWSTKWLDGTWHDAQLIPLICVNDLLNSFSPRCAAAGAVLASVPSLLSDGLGRKSNSIM